MELESFIIGFILAALLILAGDKIKAIMKGIWNNAFGDRNEI